MRMTLLTCAAVLGLAATASAQTTAPDSRYIRPGHVPGVGESLPLSNRASNILPGDSRSTIAPTLPTPAGGQNASAGQYLSEAQAALNAHQTGRAQEALERAETAMLQRSVPAGQAGAPDEAPDVRMVAQARNSLARRDYGGAQQANSAAMTAGR